MTALNQLIAIEHQRDLVRAASSARAVAAGRVGRRWIRGPRLRRRRSADVLPGAGVPRVKACPPAA